MLAPAAFPLYPGAMTLRACVRLLLLAALMLAPLGRLGVAQAMAATPAAGMAIAHCADMPAPASGHHQKMPAPDGERAMVNCMAACAAMAPPPALVVAPPPPAAALPVLSFLASLSGIQPEADPPPPRIS